MSNRDYMVGSLLATLVSGYVGRAISAERLRWVWAAVAAQSKLIIGPLSRRTWSIAYGRYHLHLHIQWGLAYYHFCRQHQSLTTPIRGPSKRRYRTPVMAANLVRKCWLVQDLLQLPVPEGIWLDFFPAAKGCW